MRSWSSLQFRGPRGPFRHEAEDVFLGRLRCECLEPAHRLAADVAEGVHAPHAGPDDVRWREVVDRSVEGGLYLAAEDEVRLLEGVIVQADADAWLVFDEEHAVVPGAEVLVDHPLEKHTLEA